MRNNRMSATSIFVLKLGFVLFGLLAIWILAGMAEGLGPWWLYILASVGSATIGILMLGTAAKAERDPDNDATRIGGGR